MTSIHETVRQGSTLAHDESDPLTDYALSVGEAARLLGCDPSTVRKLLRRRRLRGHRIGSTDQPRGVRVSLASVLAWKRRHAVGGDGQYAEAVMPRSRARRRNPAAEKALAELRAMGVDV